MLPKLRGPARSPPADGSDVKIAVKPGKGSAWTEGEERPKAAPVAPTAAAAALTDDPVAIAKQFAFRETQSILRRVVRLVGLFFFLLLALALWAIIAALSRVTISTPYDHTRDELLPIQVMGCDVVIVPVEDASDARIEVDYFTLGTKIRHEFVRDAGSENLKYVLVENQSGCEDTADRECREMCKIVVKAPPDTYGFWIYQDRQDKAPSVEVVVTDGVRLKELRVVGLAFWSTAGPSIRVTVEEGAVIENAAAYTDGGQIVSYAKDVKSVDFYSETNSVRLLGYESPGQPQRIWYRQPESNVCLRVAGVEGSTVELDPDPWALCPMDTYSKYPKLLTSHFDSNHDYFVDTAEFTAGMASLPYCCGGSCPFYSWCGGFEYQLFTTDYNKGEDNSYGGRAGVLSDVTFVSRVHNLNLTGIVPQCRQHIEVRVPNPSSEAYEFSREYSSAKPALSGINIYERSQPYFIQLRSNAGEVQLINIQGELEASEWTVSEFFPEGARAGIKMLKRDADLLNTEIKQNYEQAVADHDVYAVFDIIPSPGVPETRFVYTTREIFLLFEPAHLHILSAGILLPRIKHYHVHFTNNDCEPFHAIPLEEDRRRFENMLNPRPEVSLNATREIYAQLKTALLPRFQRDLRGFLVMLNKTHQPKPQPQHLVSFSQGVSGTELSWSKFESKFSDTVNAAAWVSIGIGCVLSALVTMTMITYVHFLLERRMKQTKLKKRQMKMKLRAQMRKQGQMGVSLSPSERLLLDDLHTDDTEQSNCNAFMTPYQVLTQLFVAPVRKAMVKSLSVFMTEVCEVHTTYADGGRRRPLRRSGPPGAAPKVPMLCMRDFQSAYNNFCFDRDLQPIHSVNALQRALIVDHKLKIRPCILVRLLGCTWNQQKPVLQASPGGGGMSMNGDVDVQVHEEEYSVDLAAHPTDLPVEEVLATVLKSYATVTKRYKTDFIDVFLPNTNGVGHIAVEDTLSGVMEAHCQQSGETLWGSGGVEDAEIDPALLQKVAEGLELKVASFTSRMIHGLAFKQLGPDGATDSQHPLSWFLIGTFEVFVHVVATFILPIIAIVVAFNAQQVYAMTTAMGEPMMKHHLVEMWPPGDKDWFWPSKLLILFNVAFCAVGLLRMAMHYVSCAADGAVAAATRFVFGAFYALYLYAMTAYLMTILVWGVLAAILLPGDFLPIGTGVVVVVLVMIALWKSMNGTAKKIRHAVQAVLSATVQSSIQAKALSVADKTTSQATGVPVGAAAAGAAAATQSLDKNDQKAAADIIDHDGEMTAASIFTFLDDSDNGVLDMAEFKDMFKQMDLDLDPDAQERMFAYCDLDCTNSITLDEFKDGWKYIQEEITQQTVEELGLGHSQVVIICVTVGLSLVALCAFLYLVIAVWNQESDFGAIVTSVLITGSGMISQRISAQSKAEAANADPKSFVKGVLASHADAAREPAGKHTDDAESDSGQTKGEVDDVGDDDGE